MCRFPGLCGRGGQWGGGSPCFRRCLCLTWAGNKAGVLDVAVVMEGVAPIPLWFMLACRLWARSVWRRGVLARVRLSIVVLRACGSRRPGHGCGPCSGPPPGCRGPAGGSKTTSSASGKVGAGAPLTCG